ncbi:MAG: hypothetical protein KatS3mg021_1659 [Fimbriimonadales bacterium]|nr:MAG: hypothetical protein KatS3mg021_1659 [Fimbriimonadales bacterium]
MSKHARHCCRFPRAHSGSACSRDDGETLKASGNFVGDLTIVTYKWRHLLADTLMALGRHDEAEPYLRYHRPAS